MVSHSPEGGFYIVSRGYDRDKGDEVTMRSNECCFGRESSFQIESEVGVGRVRRVWIA
jgi:hypothetical protein